MNCNFVKELIMTDYLDQELEGHKRKVVEAHLETCPACLRFAAQVKKDIKIFANATPVRLNQEKIWQRISSQIESSKNPSVIYEPVRRPSLLDRLYVRLKPVYALVAIGLVVLMTHFYLNGLPLWNVSQNEQEEVQYLASLVDEISENVDETSAGGFGTSLEEYFL